MNAHLYLPIAVLVTAVSCAGSEPGPAEGSDEGACYPNGTCNAGLSCMGAVCMPAVATVSPPPGSGGASGSTTGTTGGDAGGTTGTTGGAGGGAGGTAGTSDAGIVAAKCFEQANCKIEITIARTDGHTYTGKYARAATCARTVIAGNTAITIGDFGGRFSDGTCTGPTLAFSGGVPAEVKSPGTYTGPPLIFGAVWSLANAPFSDSGGYATPTGAQAMLTLVAIDRVPGGKLQGTLVSPLEHSGTKDKAMGTLTFDIVLAGQ